MIQLTRLTGRAFILNCDLIKSIESTPDTVITLTTNDRDDWSFGKGEAPYVKEEA